jgi:hypothetical protein
MDLEKHRLRIDIWLSPPDHRSKHLNAFKERHETTGSWFLQGGHFEEWKGLRSSFLWLHGICVSTSLIDFYLPLIDQHSWRREDCLVVSTSL